MTDDTPRPDRRTLLAGMALLASAKAWPARAEGSPAMNNVVLLGDSIFDNKSHVGSRPDVIDQLKGDLPSDWTATLVARDGSTTADIKSQIKTMPQNATHHGLANGLTPSSPP